MAEQVECRKKKEAGDRIRHGGKPALPLLSSPFALDSREKLHYQYRDRHLTAFDTTHARHRIALAEGHAIS
jgi:hypothetical protein